MNSNMLGINEQLLPMGGRATRFALVLLLGDTLALMMQ
jgi:hypothetical protein